ncbi:hypothetical protein [Nocardioides pacificus]
MTNDDLATLLRDHVTRDEPAFPLPDVALAEGRRRRRRSRITLAGGSLAALGLIGAVVVPLASRDAAPAGAEQVMDPASAAALESYDAREMPALMDERVREVLDRSVPDLGASRFTAFDSQHNDLPEEHWDKASGLSVEYGAREHSWSVSISHARGEAEGDPDKYCASGLEEGYYLECAVERTDGGDVVISKLEALRPMRGGGWMVVDGARLADFRLDRLWFDHTVKVVKSETLVTYVSEVVKAIDRDPAGAGFATPIADLAEIGADPVLVMPLPPPGENGCPAWSLDGENLSCGTTEGVTPNP